MNPAFAVYAGLVLLGALLIVASVVVSIITRRPQRGPLRPVDDEPWVPGQWR